MEVEIISSETIKPTSSPPSLHLKFFKLSVLDQLSPFTYTSLVFFYTPKQSNDPLRLSHDLKTSLSKTLSEFYLLAGAIENNALILGNGSGALFRVARIHGAMSEALDQPSFESLSRFIPFRFVQTMSSSAMEASKISKLEEENLQSRDKTLLYHHQNEKLHPQVAVQVNAFSGGGVAVGLCFLHKIIDGTTLSGFLRRWVAVAGDCMEEDGGARQWPEYESAAATFPGRDFVGRKSWLSKGYSPFVGELGRICRRRFVFENEAILEMKKEIKLKNIPTSVEMVTAFIWKFLMKSVTLRFGSQRPSVLTHAVDLRRRMTPPLPPTSFGNIFWSAVAHYNSPKVEIELSELVNILQQSFAEIDDKFVAKMAGEEGFENISKWYMRMQEVYSSKPYSYGFTSWRNMGLNEVEFGWGKPSWVSFAGPENSVLKNVVVLKEAILGDGIEAWIMLDEDEMNLLENDQQFLAFASLNPTIHLA